MGKAAQAATKENNTTLTMRNMLVCCNASLHLKAVAQAWERVSWYQALWRRKHITKTFLKTRVATNAYACARQQTFFRPVGVLFNLVFLHSLPHSQENNKI